MRFELVINLKTAKALGLTIEAAATTLVTGRGRVESLTRRTEGQALIEGDGMEAIFHHGADANEAVAVGEQCPQVARGGIGDPDLREAVMFEEIEQVTGVAPIGLRLANDHRADLDGLAHEERVAKPLHHGMEPKRVAGTFDANRDGRGQSGVEPLHLIPHVRELLLERFSRVGVEDGDLLLPCVQIASHQCHELASSRLPLWRSGRSTLPANARLFS
jgi:hypothetical protein